MCKETKEFDNLSLLQTERKLKDYHLTLQKEKERRLEELLPLLEEEATLAVRLGMQCSNLDPEVVPSQNDMKELVVSITMLKEEAGKRENAFQTTKTAIVDLLLNLDIDYQDSFTQSFLHDSGDFVISKNNLEKCQKVLRELQSMWNERIKKISDLKIEIQKLWQMLPVPIEQQEKLLEDTNDDYKKTTLEKLTVEFERLEEMKRIHLKDFVAEVRSRIETQWEICCVGLNERQEFTPFTCTVYTEQLLTDHETELKRLTEFETENQELLQGIITRNELLQNFLILEEKANEPGRYNNRGGALLKEEKKRKQIEKKLPGLESNLKNLAALFEEKNGKPFSYYGQSLEDFFEKQWNEYLMEKENARIVKQKEKDKLIQLESKLGTKHVATRNTPQSKKKTFYETNLFMKSPARADRSRYTASTASGHSAASSSSVSSAGSRKLALPPRKIPFGAAPPVPPRASKNVMSIPEDESITSYSQFKGVLSSRSENTSVLFNGTMQSTKKGPASRFMDTLRRVSPRFAGRHTPLTKNKKRVSQSAGPKIAYSRIQSPIRPAYLHFPKSSPRLTVGKSFRRSPRKQMASPSLRASRHQPSPRGNVNKTRLGRIVKPAIPFRC